MTDLELKLTARVAELEMALKERQAVIGALELRLAKAEAVRATCFCDPDGSMKLCKTAPVQQDSSVIDDAPRTAVRHDSSVIEQPKQEGLADVAEAALSSAKTAIEFVYGRARYKGIDPFAMAQAVKAITEIDAARALLASQPAEQDAPDLFKQMGLPDVKFPGVTK